ncbi:beta-ketoacyl-ACP reductase [Natranaeroarchaeum sulfidigenes]|uniref:Short-chain alcohol dehydrogenase n=1 Tax=Natranaeroarchaeum sulfidigenes TaxID=2784880 RepID=A0A897MSG2_9EURY|nr:beta-ketoacyl-ACP reductase [Natranaeroarchaeum sulfidigenes]QSG01899.1 Short-chain alcohol dehydrogenase [Natranaeroarchaeum sulfidigenes]
MDNRTCLITGSSRGIGRGIAEHLAASGANVVINYRSSTTKAEDVVEEIRTGAGSAMAAQADVTGRREVEAMREEIHDEFGPVDVLVNNAGITQDTRFEEMTREEWDQVIDVNLGGVFNVTQTFFDDIKTAEEGRLINISSIVGKQGNFGQANYATAKSGLFGFTRTIALELARSGSTANAVCPGFTETDMLAEVDDHIQEKILEDIPLDRFATIDDIASTVRFLASEDSSYITGEVIDVNGGMDL